MSEAITANAEAADETEPLALDFDLPEPPQKVWRALTEPDTLARWLAPAPASFDAAPLDQEPGRRVSYRWRDGEAFDGVVTFSIALNAVGGTRLTIVQVPGVTARLYAATRPALACIAGRMSRRRLDAANQNFSTRLRAA